MAAGEDELEPLVRQPVALLVGIDGSELMCAIVSAFRSNVRSRRSLSMARFRAVVTIHAPGLRGGPSTQASAAAAKASCTASSARARSPVARATAATDRPHSSRKVRSSDSIYDLAG